MKKSKKLFGLFNIVDLIIIVLILCAAGFGIKILLGGGTINQLPTETKTYVYVVEGREVLEETADFPEIGANVYNSSTSAYLGTIKDVWMEPFTETIFNRETNRYEKVSVEGFGNIYVAIEGIGIETERDITVEGVVVKVGGELNVKGKGFAFKGYIVEVRDGE